MSLLMLIRRQQCLFLCDIFFRRMCRRIYFVHFCWQPTLFRRQWHPTPVLLPGKSHGQRSLVGCSPWGREESDTTERLHFHFSFSCIGEGNGNPLQCSCLENPRDRGAWWAAIYGVTQSRTRLKWLSSNTIQVFEWLHIKKMELVPLYRYMQGQKDCRDWLTFWFLYLGQRGHFWMWVYTLCHS